MDYSIFEKLIKIWSSPYLKSGLFQMLKKHSKKFNLDLIFLRISGLYYIEDSPQKISAQSVKKWLSY